MAKISNNETECLLITPPDLPSRYPFLGICLLAGLLRENHINVDILDSSVLEMNIAEIIKHIKSVKPRIIGISVMTPALQTSYRLVQAIKEHYPESIIVVGGAHIDADPKSIQYLGVSYGFYGECEFEFLQFCKSILSGQKPSSMAGFILYENDKFIIGEKKVLKDLDALPPPAYDLLPIGRYYSPSTYKRTISFISSRGCPYKCLFCSKLQQKPFRYLSTENIIKQLDWLVNQLDIEWVEFVDEIFTLHYGRVRSLCKAIIESKLKFEWGCGTRVDRIDEELIVLMKEAGCRKIGFGIESGVERIRNVIKKNITTQQITDALDICLRHKIKTQCCFILGHPTETTEEMWKTVKFAQKLRSNYCSFGKMLPIPGSELFELAVKNGEIDSTVWIDFMHGKSKCPIYIPQSILEKDLHSVFRKSWFYTYFYPRNIWLNRDVFFKLDYLIRGAKAFWDFSCKRDY